MPDLTPCMAADPVLARAHRKTGQLPNRRELRESRTRLSRQGYGSLGALRGGLSKPDRPADLPWRSGDRPGGWPAASALATQRPDREAMGLRQAMPDHRAEHRRRWPQTQPVLYNARTTACGPPKTQRTWRVRDGSTPLARYRSSSPTCAPKKPSSPSLSAGN